MKLRYLLLAPATSACAGNPGSEQTNAPAATAHLSPTDERFDRCKNRFMLDYWQLSPDYAAAPGFHKYDSLPVVPDAGQRRREAAFGRDRLAALGQFGLDSFSPNNQIDWRMLRNELVSQRWYADTRATRPSWHCAGRCSSAKAASSASRTSTSGC